MNPSVSVIIPTYNRAERLREALGSVSHQTYRDFETIVVDDGSTDSTAEVVAEACTAGTVYIRQENAGPAAARNTGVAVARGKYLAFLDDDDVWYPRKLDLQVPVLGKNPEIALVCGAGYAVHGGQRKPLRWVLPAFAPTPSEVIQWFLDGNFIGMCSVLVRREAVRDNGGFNGWHAPCEDTDLWLRLASRGYRFAYLSEPTWEYRYHETNTTSNELRAHAGAASMWKQFLRSYEPSVGFRTQCSERLSRLLRDLGHEYYVAREPWKALGAWRDAVALDHSMLDVPLVLLMMKSLAGPRVLNWGRKVRQTICNPTRGAQARHV